MTQIKRIVLGVLVILVLVYCNWTSTRPAVILHGLGIITLGVVVLVPVAKYFGFLGR